MRVAGGDADHARRRRGVLRRREVLARRGLIAGGGDDDDPLRLRVGDRAVESRRSGVALERQVDDVGAVVGRPEDAERDHARVTLAGGVEHPHRQDLARPAVARHADAVVAPGGGHPGDEGAMTVRVAGLAVAHEVGAAQHLAGQIGRRGVDSRVDDGDDRGGAARRRAPRFGHADSGRAPLRGVQRVVG